MQDQTTLKLIDANREILHTLLKDEPQILHWLQWVSPQLGDSGNHSGETALILVCDSKPVACELVKQLKKIADRVRGAIPFAEICIKVNPEALES